MMLNKKCITNKINGYEHEVDRLNKIKIREMERPVCLWNVEYLKFIAKEVEIQEVALAELNWVVSELGKINQ